MYTAENASLNNPTSDEELNKMQSFYFVSHAANP